MRQRCVCTGHNAQSPHSPPASTSRRHTPPPRTSIIVSGFKPRGDGDSYMSSQRASRSPASAGESGGTHSFKQALRRQILIYHSATYLQLLLLPTSPSVQIFPPEVRILSRVRPSRLIPLSPPLARFAIHDRPPALVLRPQPSRRPGGPGLQPVDRGELRRRRRAVRLRPGRRNVR